MRLSAPELAARGIADDGALVVDIGIAARGAQARQGAWPDPVVTGARV